MNNSNVSNLKQQHKKLAEQLTRELGDGSYSFTTQVKIAKGLGIHSAPKSSAPMTTRPVSARPPVPPPIQMNHVTSPTNINLGGAIGFG